MHFWKRWHDLMESSSKHLHRRIKGFMISSNEDIPPEGSSVSLSIGCNSIRIPLYFSVNQGMRDIQR